MPEFIPTKNVSVPLPDQRDENVNLCFRGTTLFHPIRDALRMLTHPCSVTGAPVCRYFRFSQQPLRGEFGKNPTMPRTNRQLSESEEIRLLFRIFAFMINYYSTLAQLCQAIW